MTGIGGQEINPWTVYYNYSFIKQHPKEITNQKTPPEGKKDQSKEKKLKKKPKTTTRC